MKASPRRKGNAAARTAALGLAVLILVAGLAAGAAPGTMGAARTKLSKAHAEFLDKVDYIISKEERKIFRELPESGRDDFIAEFWKRRDPTPETERNEFKMEYFSRIEQANRMFSGGASPGWLQDRGRVWITLGPPDNRETYPRGVTFYGVPTEIWYYGFFPILFVDERWVDDYRLDPTSATQLTVLNQAQHQWNQPLESLPRGYAQSARPAALAGLEVRIEKADGDATRFVLVLPYKNIWMKSKGDRFEGGLEVDLKVLDAAGAEAPLRAALATNPLYAAARADLGGGGPRTAAEQGEAGGGGGRGGDQGEADGGGVVGFEHVAQPAGRQGDKRDQDNGQPAITIAQRDKTFGFSSCCHGLLLFRSQRGLDVPADQPEEQPQDGGCYQRGQDQAQPGIACTA